MSRRKSSKKHKFYKFEVLLNPLELYSLRIALSNYSCYGALTSVQVRCPVLLSIFNSKNAHIYEI